MLLIVLSASGFGAVPIFASMATSAGARLLNVLAWRYAIGALLLMVAAGGMRMLRVPARQLFGVLVLAGGAQAFIAFTSLSALDYMPAAPLSFLFYTYPAWVAVLAAVRGSERLTRPRLLALGLSLAGIAIMVGAPAARGLQPTGVALALVSAFAYALYIPLIGWYQQQIAETAVAVYAALGAGVFLFGIDVITGGISAHMNLAAWEAVLALAVWSTVVAFLAFLRGLRTLGPVRTAIVSTIEPFWTAMLGALLLGQPASSSTIEGGTLIAAAVILLQWQARD
ncbi:MAG TPA: DMT family transporter [Gemmatimonadaceae bacterium]|nr:DMT family transporter [Gemmatimonadaceae bacterium]